tara:strand:+ start:1715 stop:2107 length:393 start_codon:yes stop_codon:yes gene_type:complete
LAIFNSPHIKTRVSAKRFFEKYSNLNNLKEILPTQIVDYKSTEKTCSFKIEGFSEIQLELNEAIPYKKISLISKDYDLNISLNCFIEEEAEKAIVYLEIDVDVNFFTKRIVEQPLNNLLKTLSQKIKELK